MVQIMNARTTSSGVPHTQLPETCSCEEYGRGSALPSYTTKGLDMFNVGPMKGAF